MKYWQKALGEDIQTMRRRLISRVLIMLITTIFVAEFMIMLLLRFAIEPLLATRLTPLFEAMVDSFLLILALSPLVYIFFFEPMFFLIAQTKESRDIQAAGEKKYRDLTESVSDWIWEVDSQGVYTYTSPKVKDLIGYEPDEIIGKTPFDLMPPEEAKRVSEIFLSIAKEKKPFAGLENTNVHKDGSLITLETSGEPILSSGGDLLGYRGIDRDITERKQASAQIERERNRAQKFLDIARVMIVVVDDHGNVLLINDEGASVLGRKKEDITGKNWFDNFIPAESKNEALSIYKQVMLGEIQLVEQYENEIIRADGDKRLIAWNNSYFADDSGKIVGTLSSGEDITDKRENKNLKVLNQLLKISLLDLSLQEQLRRSLEIVLKSRVAAVKPKGMIFLAREDESDFEMVGSHGMSDEGGNDELFEECLCSGTVANRKTVAKANMVEEHEALNRPVIGQSHYAIPIISNARKDQVLGVICLYPQSSMMLNDRDVVFLDTVTNTMAALIEHKQTQNKLDYLSFHDLLTDLPGWKFFEERLEHMIGTSQNHDRSLVLFVVDIDRFKNINEGFGHQIGDEVLKEVAKRLSSEIQEIESLARIGADEFCVILGGESAVDNILNLADRMLKKLRLPYRSGDTEVLTSVSIGASIFPTDTPDSSKLLAHAKAAMRQVKKNGGNGFFFYKPFMNERIAERINLENRIKEALEKDEFVPYFQPVVEINSSRIIGMEALVRWKKSEGSLILPGDFIPLAEETGQIIPLGKNILQNACAITKSWIERGFSDLKISVNVSARQFDQQDFGKMVKQVLRETGLPAESLDLEITESVISRDLERTGIMMFELIDAGVSFSIDDFGTGYSSLLSLKMFPISTLKIDQGFVADMTSNPNSSAIVRTTISMAKGLGLKVIAEGVETNQQLEFLRRLKCDSYQGFLFSAARPADEFEQLLIDNRGKAA